MRAEARINDPELKSQEDAFAGGVMAIASGTWRRMLQMKVVYFLIACVWIIIGSALNYDVISLEHHRDLMIDVSLVLNSIAAILIVVSLTFDIPKELKEGVASTLITKPLGRTQYLIGKMVGTVVTGAIICAIIAIGFFAIYHICFPAETIGLPMLQTHLLVIASIVPMSAMGVLFSIFLPETMASIITVVAIWFSYSTKALAKLPVVYGGILPNLDLFNFRSHAVYQTSIPWSYIGLVTLWGIAFAVFTMSIASMIFSYKDIK